MRGYEQFSPPTFVPIFLGFVCFLGVPAWGFAQQLVFDEEMIGQWKAYEAFSRGLQGTARSSGTLLNGKPRAFVNHYKQNRDCAYLTKDMSDPAFANCFIYNPRYAASIKKSKENPANVALLKYEEDPKTPFMGGATIDDRFFGETSSHFCCCGVRLSHLVSKPEFSAKSLGKESHDGRDLIRVDYDYLNIHQTTLTKTKIHGSAFFDPSRHWCIYKDKTTLKRNFQGGEWTNEYDDRYETIDHPSGFPILKRRTRHTKRTIVTPKQSKQENAIAITDYEWEYNDHVPTTAFTLSAFGLPEPVGIEPIPPSRTWLWLLGAALAAAAIALWFAWLKRRHQNAASPSS